MGKVNRRICGVPKEAATVPRNPEKVRGCPENGTRYIGGRKWDNRELTNR